MMTPTPPIAKVLSASDLFAISQTGQNVGNDQCHYCGSACEKIWLHDDPPPVPFVRTVTAAKLPHNHYVCRGCFLWRCKRQSIFFLTGGVKDGQEPCNYSWWITEQGAWAIRQEDKATLWDLVIDPPHRFILSLMEGPNQKNLLQLCVANDYPIMKADSVLSFTLNNTPFQYNPYDLREAISAGDANGKSPGVVMLFQILGRPPKKEKPKQERGRPAYTEIPVDGRASVEEVKRSGVETKRKAATTPVVAASGVVHKQMGGGTTG